MSRKWVSLTAGVLIQTILGGVYAWSAYIPLLNGAYGITRSQGGFIFGLCIAVFTLTLTISGRFIAIHGPKKTAALCAVFHASGFILASFSNGSFPALLLSLGIITGIGIGFGYACPLTVGMKWFPNNRGLVTGIAVAGFGAGAIFLSSAAVALHGKGIDILAFYGYWGGVSGLALFLAAMFLTEPTAHARSPNGKLSYDGILTVPFAICAVGIFAGTFAGLLVNGNLASLTADAGMTRERTSLAISLFAVGNALGRIAWGSLFDRFAYKSIPLSLTCLLVAVLSLILCRTESQYLIVIGSLGFCFGANFVVYASSIARFFGQNSFPLLYPICFLFYGFAGLVGPGVGGYLADLLGSYDVPLFLSAGALLFAICLSLSMLSAFSSRVRFPSRNPAGENAE